ncbi:hypothetical protein HPG69_001214, partial [Diceros bicornis minor]
DLKSLASENSETNLLDFLGEFLGKQMKNVDCLEYQIADEKEIEELVQWEDLFEKPAEASDESLPIPIVLHTLLDFAVTCSVIVHIAGELKDMNATSELKNKIFDTLRNHFMYLIIMVEYYSCLWIQQILQTKTHCPLTHH